MLFRRSFLNTHRSFPVFAAIALLLTGAQAEPLAEMAAFSELKSPDLAELAGGKIETAHGAAMTFPRDMAVQACYVVPLPLPKTVEFHKRWNPARHPELKVYLHHELSSKPVPSEFQVLATAPENAAVRALIDATQKLNPRRPELQMGAGEAAQFAKLTSGEKSRKGSMPPEVTAFWSSLLCQRTLAFLAGGVARQPAYDVDRESICASDEIARLLKEQPKICRQFQPLLTDAALTNGPGKLAPSLYFELFDVEGRGAITLGASYSKPVKESVQLVDAQYYGSDGYYILLSFYQFWPVKTGAGEATLVWRGDLLSSATLTDLHGMERMGSMSAMKKEIQKSIGFLQADATGGR